MTSFLGDCVFSNVVLFANGIETNTIKQRTGTALALTSPTINISGSTAINLTGPTNCINDATFQQAVRTNFIQSQANTPLIIAALMSDGKTQTNMHLTSPVIQLDNSYGLVNEAAVYISGNLTFNNPVSNPHITGRNLNIYSRTNANPPVNTPLSISSSTCNISQETLNITSSVSNNITGQTNFDKNINVLSNRSATIGPPIMIHTGYNYNISFVNTTDTQLNVGAGTFLKGSNTFPSGAFQYGQIFKITLTGAISTATATTSTYTIKHSATTLASFTFSNATVSSVAFRLEIYFSINVAAPNNLGFSNSTAHLQVGGTTPQSVSNSVSNTISNLQVITLDIFSRTSAGKNTVAPAIFMIEQM